MTTTRARGSGGASMFPRIGSPSPERSSNASDIESEQNHVAVLHDVFLPLTAHLPRRARRLLAAAGDVIIVRNGLGADEAALEVGVNLPRRLGRSRAAMNRPGARFLRAGGEERLQIEQLVRGANEGVQSRLFQSHLLEEIVPLRGGKLRDLRLELAADDDH